MSRSWPNGAVADYKGMVSMIHADGRSSVKGHYWVTHDLSESRKTVWAVMYKHPTHQWERVCRAGCKQGVNTDQRGYLFKNYFFALGYYLKLKAQVEEVKHDAEA